MVRHSYSLTNIALLSVLAFLLGAMLKSASGQCGTTSPTGSITFNGGALAVQNNSTTATVSFGGANTYSVPAGSIGTIALTGSSATASGSPRQGWTRTRQGWVASNWTRNRSRSRAITSS